MADFAQSYLGQLRSLIGDRLVLMPGARIIIENPAGEVLIEHRADFRLWGLPGGAAEVGEPLERTIAREVMEETGMALGVVTAFGFASDPQIETVTFPNGDRCQYFSLLFHTRDYYGEPRPMDGEALELRWCHPDALPEMVPNMRRTVEAWLRYRDGGGFQLI